MNKRNVLIVAEAEDESNSVLNCKKVLKYKCDKIYDLYTEGENTNIFIEK